MKLRDLKGALSYPPVRAALLVSLLSVVLCFASLGLWLSSALAIDDAQARVDALEARSDRLNNLYELTRSVSANRATLSLVRKKVRPGASRMGVMAYIQALAERCEVRILEHKTSDMRELNGRQKHRIAAEGRYGAVRQFVTKLTPESPELSAITHLRLFKAEAHGFVRAELDLLSYGGKRGND